MYQRWYGNQLQQVIHRDCVALAHEVAALSPSSSLYDHRGALIDWIDAAREFNQDGECAQACTIQDLCFSLLEYGTAIVEGAVAGVGGAAEDLIQHPINTAACIIMPHGVVVYQLSKVLVNVADIGLTYACDKKKGRRKLDDYIAPLNSIIEAIHNKQVSGPDVVRGVTQFAVGRKAQSKLLTGLGKFYGTSKAKLERFIKENPLADSTAYLNTPDGLLVKYAIKEGNLPSNFVQKVTSIKEFFQNFELGKILAKKSIKLNQRFQGQAIYRLEEKVNDVLKKGYYYYLYNLHCDHIEVFDKIGNVKKVLNLNGSINVSKANIALSQARKIALT